MLSKLLIANLVYATIVSSVSFAKVPTIQEGSPTQYCIGVHFPGDGQYQAYGYSIFCDSRTKPTIRSGSGFMFNFASTQTVINRALKKAKALGFEMRKTAVPYDKKYNSETIGIFDNSASVKNKPKEVVLFNGGMIVNYTVGTKIKYDTVSTQTQVPQLPEIADGVTPQAPATVTYSYYVDHTTLVKNGFVKVAEFELHGVFSYTYVPVIYVYER